MAGKQLSVNFWGVRGSYPVPGQGTARYGGNTSCVEIQAGEHIIILDAGTGIIDLGHKLVQDFKSQPPDKTKIINLLFSHTHHDHVQGLPYFAPTFRDDCALNIFGQKSFSQGINESLSLYMAAQFSPIEFDELTCSLSFTNINENNILVFRDDEAEPVITTRSQAGDLTQKNAVVSLMRNYAHPKIGTFVIKVELNGKSVVYATDTEGYVGGDTRLAQFAKNASVLIHDAQYTPDEYLKTQGFGHSTYEMAAQVAKAANVENLVLFHHDPNHDDEQLAAMEAKAKKIFPNAIMGAEGLGFDF